MPEEPEEKEPAAQEPPPGDPSPEASAEPAPEASAEPAPPSQPASAGEKAEAGSGPEGEASGKKPEAGQPGKKEEAGQPGKDAGDGDSGKPKSAEAPSASELLSGEDTGKKIIRAKGSKNIMVGVASIMATFNNTLVTISDMSGNVIAWSSSGRRGYSGSRKSTAFAAQQVSQDAARKAMAHGLKQVEVRVKGPGAGRESAIRALQAIGLEITAIKDVTPVPHNGCRPRKKRRV